MNNILTAIFIAIYTALIFYLSLIDFIFWLPIFLSIGLVASLIFIFDTRGGLAGFIFIIFISIITLFTSNEMSISDLLFGILMHFIIILIMVKLKLSLDDLRNSEKRYKTLIEKANDGVVLLNNGNIKYINPVFLTMLGCSEKEIINRKIFSIFTKKDRDEFRKHYKKIISGKNVSPFYEAKIIDCRGNYLNLEMSVTQILDNGKREELVIFRDITKRKKVEEILHYQEEKFKALSENIPDIIARFDEEGRYVYVNTAAEKHYGLQKKDFFWKTEKDLNLFKGNSNTFTETIKFVFATKKASSFYNETVDTDNKRYYYTILVPEMTKEGTVRSVLSVSRDITEVREIDRAKSEFISLTSHQLRSPLSVIGWCGISLLRDEDLHLTEEQREYMERIYEANRDMIKITDAFINATMLDLGVFVFNPEEVDVVALFKSLVDEYRDAMDKKDIRITAKYNSFDKVNVDPRTIKIIMRSLLSNAVDYTDKGGEISLSLIKGENNDIIFRVGDSGCGIDKEDQSKIFEKIYRTERSKKIKSYGTGLDMYIIKSIMNKKGGSISVESPNPEFKKGTAFTVTFPLNNK